MHFFRVSSLKTQLLIIILLAMLVPAAAMLYDIFIATKTDDVLINETEQKLIQITNLINEQMQREINISDEIRCATLSDIFNSVVVPLIEHYPGVRICLYERETDNIIIYGHLHEFGARLPEEKKERERRIYNETQAGIASVLSSGTPITRLGKTYDDRFLEHLVPIKNNNSEVIAVIWTEQMMHPIFAQSSRVRLVLRYIIFCVFGIGVAVTLFTISGIVNRIRIIKDGIIKMEKNLNNRLPEMSGEMGHVAAAINEMAQVLAEKEQLIDQYRRSENLMSMGRTITEIAHELRAPVSVIQATAQAMEINIKDTQLKDYVERIEQQVERHNKLINEILDFGRPDPGTMEPLDINDLVNSVLTTMEPLFSKADIMLEFKTTAQTPLIISGNAEKLKQVFINLSLNALDAMQQHGTLTIQTYSKDGYALVSVRDTGEGIAPEDLPNIFEPFYTKKARGSGLGLAISKRIIQIHGGIIDAKSEAGSGSIFTMRLPLQQICNAPEQD
ncbi:ATP-binding protein [Desulfoscipio gibsoniae]|uniref:histidine kinase n=1 Tax=Desulfoscipio gibsoniae DSM 7213 TaxID=767817 RepID=R4KN84_9FIRM|nr:ATP-binding protein [Desulfoscipio gibsoniae]AGL03012.1 signal transduction histidine kinase [Desulfoscipio gibsoniae DSM 7213]